ncbi:MAG: MFS transporter [Ktedonobacteraceae bacterium]|nr:MFS transporter [Ktedonobacteraceae bacterium]
MNTMMDRSSISVLSVGHLCIDLCQGAIPALLPVLLVQRHLSYTAAGGLILATNLASSVIQPIFGRFADRFSIPWLLPAGLLLAGIGLGLAGFMPNYWLIALSVALSGIGIAAFHPEAARLMHKAAGAKKTTGMSIFANGGEVGFALGPLVTSAFLIMLGLAGTTLFIVPMAIVSLVLIGFFQRFLSYRSEGKQLRNTGYADSWGPFVRLTATVICRSMIFYGLNTFLPLYWIIVLRQSNTAGDVALSMLLAVGIIGTFIGGRAADRYGRRIVVLIGLGALAPLILAFVILSVMNIAIAFILLIPLGLALFAPFSVMVVMGQEYVPNYVGTASGVALGLAVTTGGIAAPIFGHIADLYGIHTALLSLACLPLVATGLALTLPQPPIPLIAKK